MIASFMKIGSLLTALALPFTQKTVLNRTEKMAISAAATNFHSFQMMEKVVVKGSEKCDLYQWLSDKSKNGWNEKEPSWNFCKYVINEKGELQNFFASGIKPNSPEFLAAIGK